MVFAGDEIGLEGVLGEDSRRPMPWQHPETWDRETHASYAALLERHRPAGATTGGGDDGQAG